MKTFKQFKEDNQYVSEGAGAIIGGALKLGGKALAHTLHTKQERVYHKVKLNKQV